MTRLAVGCALVLLDSAVGTSLHGRLPDVFVRAAGRICFGR